MPSDADSPPADSVADSAVPDSAVPDSAAPDSAAPDSAVSDPAVDLGVTQLLGAWQGGDVEAKDQLFPLIYDELRRLARSRMRSEGPQATLQPTALVHEAYLRLESMDVEWNDRGHFYAMASRAMRRILVDRARSRIADKRGGGVRPVSLDDKEIGDMEIGEQSSAMLVALDEGLRALAEHDERKAKVVELRYFAGFTIDETAEAFGLSHTTIEKDMKVARAFLARYLTGSSQDSSPAP